MLKILDKPEFQTTVRVNTAHLQGEFKARFVALRSSELKAAEETAQTRGEGPQGVLFAVCRSFDQVQMPDGQPITDLAELLDVPGIGPAMTKAYYRALWEEAAGN